MRAGSKLHLGVEVPINADIFVSKSGHECYLSGIEESNAIIYIFELQIFVKKPLFEITKYLKKWK